MKRCKTTQCFHWEIGASGSVSALRPSFEEVLGFFSGDYFVVLTFNSRKMRSKLLALFSCRGNGEAS